MKKITGTISLMRLETLVGTSVPIETTWELVERIEEAVRSKLGTDIIVEYGIATSCKTQNNSLITEIEDVVIQQ